MKINLKKQITNLSNKKMHAGPLAIIATLIFCPPTLMAGLATFKYVDDIILAKQKSKMSIRTAYANNKINTPYNTKERVKMLDNGGCYYETSKTQDLYASEYELNDDIFSLNTPLKEHFLATVPTIGIVNDCDLIDQDKRIVDLIKYKRDFAIAAWASSDFQENFIPIKDKPLRFVIK